MTRGRSEELPRDRAHAACAAPIAATTIVSMPPPSSGGVHLIEMLNILEGFPLRAGGARLGRRRAAPDDRGDEARLCRPRGISRRPGVRQRAGRGPDLEALRRRSCAARSIRSAHAPARDPRRQARAPREGDNTTHYSVVDRDGNAVANTYTLNFNYGARPGRRRHRHPAQQRARRLRRQARRAERLRPRRRRRQCAGPGQAAALVDDADHRAQGRQAVCSSPARPAAAASSPRCCRSILNVIDHQMNIARSGRRAAHASSMAAGPGRAPSAGFRRHDPAPGSARPQGARRRTVGSANSIMVTPDGLAGAADPRQRGALAAGY